MNKRYSNGDVMPCGFLCIHSMMCQYGMSESRSATFPIEKARHLLDDSFLESQSPVRIDPHSTSVSNGLSLGVFTLHFNALYSTAFTEMIHSKRVCCFYPTGSSESSFGEELSPGMER